MLESKTTEETAKKLQPILTKFDQAFKDIMADCADNLSGGEEILLILNFKDSMSYALGFSLALRSTISLDEMIKRLKQDLLSDRDLGEFSDGFSFAKKALLEQK